MAKYSSFYWWVNCGRRLSSVERNNLFGSSGNIENKRFTNGSSVKFLHELVLISCEEMYYGMVKFFLIQYCSIQCGIYNYVMHQYTYLASCVMVKALCCNVCMCVHGLLIKKRVSPIWRVLTTVAYLSVLVQPRKRNSFYDIDPKTEFTPNQPAAPLKSTQRIVMFYLNSRSSYPEQPRMTSIADKMDHEEADWVAPSTRWRDSVLKVPLRYLQFLTKN